ncbi:MAG: RNA polymerase sigma factor [Acidimicrobiales bacterium]
MSADQDLDELTDLALEAQDGDREALEALCRAMQEPLYRLALRFSGNPADAEDGAQEVMIRLVTNLGSFEFGAFLDLHATDPAYDPVSQAEYEELCADVRLSCTYGMLLCLSRDQRVVYLVGDLFGFSDREGAEICGITRAAFRQRLARARAVMRGLMGERCGLVRAGNPCRCRRLVNASIEAGILEPDDPRWARHRGVTLPIETTTIDSAASELDVAAAVAEVYRSDPSFAAPAVVWQGLVRALPTLLRPHGRDDV